MGNDKKLQCANLKAYEQFELLKSAKLFDGFQSLEGFLCG